MAAGVRADEFGRLGRRFAGLNLAILASMAAALGLAVFAYLAGQAGRTVTSQGGRPVAQERLPASTVSPKPVVVRPQTILTAPAGGQPTTAGKSAAPVTVPQTAAPGEPAVVQGRADTGTAAQAAPARAAASTSPAEPARPAVLSLAQPCPARGWYVQLGALRGAAHVRDLVAQGRGHGFPVCTSDARGLTLVLAGPYHDGREALRARDRLKQTVGIRGFLRKDGGRD